MKIIRNGVCYVEGKDLLRYPLPDFISVSDIDLLTKDEFIAFKDEKSQKYFDSRKDIVDYNSICNLNEDLIENKIMRIKSRIKKLELKIKEKNNEKYQKLLKDLYAIYDTLFKYKMYKKSIDIFMRYIELNQACKSTYDDILNNLFEQYNVDEIIKFVPGGFVEKYCLSEKESKVVKRLRNKEKVEI